MELAPLPGHPGQPSVQGRLQPAVGVADDQLGPRAGPGPTARPGSPASGPRPRRARPRRPAPTACSSGSIPMATRTAHPSGPGRRRVADLLVAGIQDQVGRLAPAGGSATSPTPHREEAWAARLTWSGGDLQLRRALSVMAATLRVETPWTYSSASRRASRPARISEKALLQGRGVEVDASRAWGTARVRAPTPGPGTVLGLKPLA